MSPFLNQLLQFMGAFFILIAFALLQLRMIDGKSVFYLILNFAGATLLNIIALYQHNWGFVLLESAWMIISIWGLLSRVVKR